MTTTPRRVHDPEGDKKRAIRLAAHAARKADAAERSLRNAIRFAVDTGASLRELEEATGRSHMTIKRTVDRSRSEDPESS